MQPKTFISAVGIACVTIAFSSSYWTKQAIAQETTLALCETNRYTVRVYNTNGQTYMRAFDRHQRANFICWSKPEERKFYEKAEFVDWIDNVSSKCRDIFIS